MKTPCYTLKLLNDGLICTGVPVMKTAWQPLNAFEPHKQALCIMWTISTSLPLFCSCKWSCSTKATWSFSLCPAHIADSKMHQGMVWIMTTLCISAYLLSHFLYLSHSPSSFFYFLCYPFLPGFYSFLFDVYLYSTETSISLTVC